MPTSPTPTPAVTTELTSKHKAATFPVRDLHNTFVLSMRVSLWGTNYDWWALTMTERTLLQQYPPKPLPQKQKSALIQRIRRMIQMYQDIADNHIIRHWVCLCSHHWCYRCPCGATYPRCTGPGGVWQPIGALVHTFHYHCGEDDEVVMLDTKFRSTLLACVEEYADNTARHPTWWTYERITELAAEKASAWRKWLDEFEQAKEV